MLVPPHQREAWLEVIKENRKNRDGDDWVPPKQPKLCSAHFVTGMPSPDASDVDYVPSLLLTQPEEPPYIKTNDIDDNGTKTNLCSLCGITYPTSERHYCPLKRRIKQKHLCPDCGKCYEYASNLEDHANIHKGLKPHACSNCEFR